STSYMDEATLCDRIGLILNGKILSIASPEDTIKAYPEQLYAVKSNSIYHLRHDLRVYERTINCYAFGEFLLISIKTNEEQVRKYLQEKGHTDVEFKAIHPTVEDI